MLEDLKLIMEANKNLLPIISKCWEYTILKDLGTDNIDSNRIDSLEHNTTHYKPQVYYKPLSTTVDFKNFD